MHILEPVKHETIWGGTRLLSSMDCVTQKIGHLYLFNGHENMSNIVKNGDFCGKTLKELFDLKKSEWNLEGFDEFPLTIALVDAAENLSIQVHPDDLTAEQLENKKIGKAESWYFLEPPENGWIYDGCRCSREQVIKAVSEDKMEAITNRLSIEKDDYVYVEAGTLHAMTAGSLVYEIEYGSDFTYRFYDFNRKDVNGSLRELHVAKAVQAIKPDILPLKRQYSSKEWIAEKYYEIKKITDQTQHENKSGELECVSIIKGCGVLDGCLVSVGTGILLYPGEKINNIEIEIAMTARIRR